MKLSKISFWNFTDAQIQSGILEFDMGKAYLESNLLQIWDRTLGKKLGDVKKDSLGMTTSFNRQTGVLSVDFVGSEVTTAGNEIVVVSAARGRGAKDDLLSEVSTQMLAVAAANTDASKTGKDGIKFIGFDAGDYSVAFKGTFWACVALSDDVQFNIATRISADANQDIPATWTMVKGQTLYTELSTVKIDSGQIMLYFNKNETDGKVIGSLRV